MSRKKRIIIVACAAIIMATGAFALTRYLVGKMNKAKVTPVEYGIEIIADKVGASGILKDSGFTITSKYDYDIEEMKKIVKVTAENDFNLNKISAGTYYLKPTEELSENEIFNINITQNEDEPDLSWAFQTVSTFKVTGTIPSKDSTYAPINTGIEINFSKVPQTMDGYFEISPKVSGRYESNGKTIAFIPKELEYDTEYTVTIKAGVKSKYGDELAEDYSYKFKTRKKESEESKDRKAYIDAYSSTMRTAGGKFIQLYADKEEFANEKFYVDIYRLNDVNTYIDVLQERQEKKADISKYSKVSSFETLLYWNGTDSGYIILPDNMEQGWYLADITTAQGIGATKGAREQVTLQITDVATYVQSSNGQTLVWCNDISTNQVIANANVQIGNTVKVTDEKGMAIFDIVSDKLQRIIVTTDDNMAFGEYLYVSENRESTFRDLYYTYLYTDREIYMPTDTIKFWGVIYPKKSEITAPKKLDVEVEGETITVDVKANGSFSGEYSFVNRTSGYESINIKVNGFTFYGKYIGISEYIKPTYTLSASYDKEYYRRGDNVTVKTQINFFDGLPANDTNLTISTGNDKKEVITDSTGEATAIFTPVPRANYGWRPYSLDTVVSTSGGEEDASTYNSVLYFPTSYMINSGWKDKNLTINANNIDFSSITDGNYDIDKLKGTAADITGTIVITRRENIKTETGEYYDFINKVNKKTYKYSTNTTEVETIPFATQNGIYSIELPYEDGSSIYYDATIKYIMPDGFSAEGRIYQENIVSYESEQDGLKDYYFKLADNNNQSYGIGEKVKFNLVEDGYNFINKGRILYTVVGDKLKNAEVTESTTAEVTFEEKHIPNCSVVGAYFDGKVIYPISEVPIYYNSEERNLDIKITTDKEIYNPGDTAKVSLQIKDKLGKTYPTNAVISVVDEAVFAIEDQVTDPLECLYEYIYYGGVKQFASHNQKTDNVTAEEGGEGEPERSIFKDTAAFIPVTTDASGKGSIEFVLPDNLTSWRITAVGVTPNVRAGTSKKNITTSLPFRINQVMNMKYTASDDFVFTARVVGTAEKLLSSLISYNASIKGNGIDKKLNFELKPGTLATFNFGKIPEGEYEVSVTAKAGNYSDGIKKTVKVINSLHEIDITKEINLDKNIDIDALRFPVKFRIYDVNNALYYKNVSKIFSTSRGNTTDQILSRELLSRKLDEIEGTEGNKDVIEVSQQFTGGVTLLPYSDEDALLTAKICAIAPELINTSSASYYFHRIIEDKESTSQDVSAAYFGLAALKEPVLVDIKYLLENNKGFDIKDNINLVAGLAFIGDTKGANEYYVKMFSEMIRETGEYRYISVGNRDEIYELTSSLAMLLTKINNSDFKSMIKYVIDKKSDKYTPALDLMPFALMYNPKKDFDGYMTYTISGEEKRIEFKDKRIQTLSLNKEELETFKIKGHKDVKMTAYYVGGIGDAITNKENAIKVTKTITGGNRAGEAGTVEIKVKFPAGAPKNSYYALSDIVPSGMRYTGKNRTKDSNWYFDERENQKLYFSVYNTTGEATISYGVRSVMSGDYLLESAIITHSRENLTGYSAQSRINIAP